MRTTVLIWALAALPGVAAAQVTTQCHDTYAGAPQLGQTCESTGLSLPSRPRTSVDPAAVVAKRCNMLDHVALPEEVCTARAAAAERAAVGELVADGKCDEAVRKALRLGDMRFAYQVRDFCAPR